MTDQKGQPAAEPEVSYRDGFDKKWEEFVTLSEEPKKEVPPKKEVAPKPELAADEEECSGCPGGKQKKKPYKVLKVQGKEVPVFSEDELVNLAQMGVDYTKKRQADSEDRKKWEGEKQTEANRLEELSNRINAMYQTIQQGGTLQQQVSAGQQTQPKPKVNVYEEYGIDEDLAEPYQKKIIEDVRSLRETLEQERQSRQQVEAITNMFVLKETVGKIAEIIKAEREAYPIEEIMEGENNLTAQQFVSLFKAKHDSAQSQGKQPDLAQIARETVREIHHFQNKAKETAVPQVSNDLSPDEFAAKYPDLFKRIVEKISDKAVAEHEEKKSIVPPSLERKSGEADLSKQKSRDSLKTTEDWLDAGFEDPEVLAALRGD